MLVVCRHYYNDDNIIIFKVQVIFPVSLGTGADFSSLKFF